MSIFFTNEEMAKTWTVVRFKDENVVEAVPTSWIANSRCYWPPFTSQNVLKAIKNHDDFDPLWSNYEVYVFKNSISGEKQNTSYIINLIQYII